MKKNIALLAGGYSGEYIISIKSAVTIERNLDTTKYNVYKIVVVKEGWYYEDAQQNKIEVDKNDFSITIDGSKIKFDIAFLAIHGTPGEDGLLQGYLQMMGIPFTGCDTVISAITFNKSYCNKVVKALNIVQVANSYHVIKNEPYTVGSILHNLKLPLFVKPAESGSSLGVSKVKAAEELLPAIEKAFKEDRQVLIEEFIEGKEYTVGVYRDGDHIKVLPATEVISKNEFFDYEAKYTSGVTEEITPADMEEINRAKLEGIVAYVYRALNCKGVVRMDFILQESSNEFYFLEVNTMPGQSENSLIPQQVRAAGMNLLDFYGSLVENALQSFN